jgi:hypothetical protein
LAASTKRSSESAGGSAHRSVRMCTAARTAVNSCSCYQQRDMLKAVLQTSQQAPLTECADHCDQ